MTTLVRHKSALIWAFFVGLICVLPMYIAPFALGERYQGIQYAPLDDEDIYRARIHEILDGHRTVASPMLYEYKDQLVSVWPINEWFYAIPAFAVGLSAAVVAGKFLLPASLFLLVYALVRQLLPEAREREWAAVTAGLLVALAVDLVDYGYVLSLLHSPPRPILWTRTVNPVIGAVELFAFLNLLALIWRRAWRYAPFVAAIVLSLTVGYYFSLGISLAALGSLFCAALLLREYDITLRFLFVGALATIIDAPYWFAAFASLGGEVGREFALRNGMFFTHAPVLNKALLAATVLFALLAAAAWRQGTLRTALRSWLFSGALLFASWVAFNQQVLTGRDIWHHHFVQYTTPLAIISLVLALVLALRERYPRPLRVLLAAFAAVSLVYGAYTVTQYRSRPDDFARLQSYGPLAEWLNANAPEDCVVLVEGNNETLERLIPAYTRCNTYTTTYQFFGTTPERIEHNFLLQIRLQGIAPADAKAYLTEHNDLVRNHFFADWAQQFGHGLEPWLEARIDELARKYRTFARGDLRGQVLAYRADYMEAGEPLPPALIEELRVRELARGEGWYLYAF